MPYCASRFRTVRRPTIEVMVGGVGVGGGNPIRLQSMTTSDTQDVEATVRQSIALAEVGCEIVRITAPNVQAAACLREIRRRFTDAGFGGVPLVADIHFLPSAAMEAVEHVEKVRVNPGNYADKKRFAVREYSDADYDRELQRLHEAFSPLVLRCRQLGRALRIGTNHGSLSDRIMNRYGDTPLGMVESALEFLRIAESHGFRRTILSMKASNPKVMIQAYRLLVGRMAQEDMHYPLHLGVTEAGDGEDGRIKGAIGIGSLLLDGLGDTLRVSLTEDSVYEIPVARAMADKAMSLWGGTVPARASSDSADPYHFNRRETGPIGLAAGCQIGAGNPPRVVVRVTLDELAAAGRKLQVPALREAPAEGLLVSVKSAGELARALAFLATGPFPCGFAVLEIGRGLALGDARAALAETPPSVPVMFLRRFCSGEGADLGDWIAYARSTNRPLAVAARASDIGSLAGALALPGADRVVFTLAGEDPAAPAADDGPGRHGLGSYRELVEALSPVIPRAPVWIRNTLETAIRGDNGFLSRLIDASILTGGLLCDGIGDLVSIETEADPARAARLSYNILQGAGARISKTEFVACPSCGRTLFDLQDATQRIRAQTGHLKGVKIAIMGCIVNGPGEMADADFGYVGGAPGKINLYVGKQCVQYNIPQAEADARLIALIRERGRWVDPVPAE